MGKVGNGELGAPAPPRLANCLVLTLVSGLGAPHKFDVRRRRAWSSVAARSEAPPFAPGHQSGNMVDRMDTNAIGMIGVRCSIALTRGLVPTDPADARTVKDAR